MARNRFVIRNEWAESLTLNIEPEGAFIALLRGEEVSVVETYESAPLTIKLDASDDGELIVTLWPGDGDVIVEKEGRNVLDGIARESVSA